MEKKFKILLIFACIMSFVKLECFSYINNKDITLRSLILDTCIMPLEYSQLDAGDAYHSVGSAQRFFGIHNMQVRVPGYEPVDLVKDDCCEYPHLFTILGKITPEFFKYNFITQRWALVKWFMPLNFGFEVKDNVLSVMSALSPYYLFAPMMAKQEIRLIETENFSDGDKKNHIEVKVNGRGVLLDGQVLHLYHTGKFIATITILSLVTGVLGAATALAM